MAVKREPASWKWYGDPQPTEVIRPGKKGVKHKGNWWTDGIDKLEVQLTSDAVRKLAASFNAALGEGKPLTFFIVPGKDSRGRAQRIRAKWRKITSGNEEELYISEYGEDVWTRYDPGKIGSLATNSVSTYYGWKGLPESLKRFILNEPEEPTGPPWSMLVEAVHDLPVYPAHKAHVRDRLLKEEPDISAEELSFRLDISLGEATVILHELGTVVDDPMGSKGG